MIVNNFWIALEVQTVEQDEPEILMQGGFRTYAEVKEYLREQKLVWGSALHYQVKNRPYWAETVHA